jgi:hypothetical protein
MWGAGPLTRACTLGALCKHRDTLTTAGIPLAPEKREGVPIFAVRTENSGRRAEPAANR